MGSFIYNLFQGLHLTFLLSKYGILLDLARIKENNPAPRSVRYLFIVTNLIFYPIILLRRKKKSIGERFCLAMQDMGPIYIKLGQALSTRPDLIGVDIAQHLRFLQDKLPEFEYDIVEQTIKKELGRSIKDIFVKFEKKAIAAASIAQVHRAKLKSGEQVAVKILRPNIEQNYHKDINFLSYIAKIVTWLFSALKRMRLPEVIDILKETMKFELNLRTEAAAASRIKDNFIDDDSLKIPHIHWEYTSRRVLTTEWIDGVSIYDQEAIEKLGLDCKKLSVNLANIFFNQAHRDGFFHADLHPGNVLVCPNGQIALIDFGIIGVLPEKDRIAIAEILYAFLKKDYTLVARVHKRVGYIPANTNLEHFAQSCRSIAEPIIGLAIKDISIGHLLSQLFHMTREYSMETQPQLILLQKTMVTIEGIEQILDKDVNMWELVQPWMKKWAVKNISPEAKLLRLCKNWLYNLADKIDD